MRKQEFTLDDFRKQLSQIKKMGSLQGLLGHLPSAGPFKNLAGAQVDDRKLLHFEAIINSMTAAGAGRPEDHQRQPPPAHRPGERPAGQRSEPAPPPVPGNAVDDEEIGFPEDVVVVQITDLLELTRCGFRLT